MKKDNQKSQIIIYKTDDGQAKIEVRFENETVWLSQNALAELFQATKQNISQHIKNIFAEGELQSNSVVKDFLTTAAARRAISCICRRTGNAESANVYEGLDR
ncbi:MAG: hypothetical protein Q7T79_00035 [bacterium]|nr:hypothetical protein [bacterium]